MHVPAWPVLPDSTLAPDAVLQKFRVASLAGLGCDCSNVDESGTCTDPEPCGTTATPPLTAGCPGSPGCPGYVDPSVNAAIQAAIPAAPDTSVVTSTGTQAAGYTIPSQSSAAWANAAAALVKGGMSLAQILTIPPGTVVSANGTILRQAPGYSVPAGVGTGVLPTSTMSGSTLMIVAVLGLAVVMMSSGRGR